MIAVALQKKLAGLGLNCPVERIEKGYSNYIILQAGNLKKSGMARDGDAKIVLEEVDGADYLQDSLKSLHKSDSIPPSLAHFEVRCPTNSWYHNSAVKFMEFFDALGLGKLHGFLNNEGIDTAIKANDKNWVGYFKELYSLDYKVQNDGARVFCATGEFLKAIDIDPAQFAKAVTIARVEKAKQFGPVRKTRLPNFECRLECV